MEKNNGGFSSNKYLSTKFLLASSQSHATVPLSYVFIFNYMYDTVAGINPPFPPYHGVWTGAAGESRCAAHPEVEAADARVAGVPRTRVVRLTALLPVTHRPIRTGATTGSPLLVVALYAPEHGGCGVRKWGQNNACRQQHDTGTRGNRHSTGKTQDRFMVIRTSDSENVT
jgi:hypothetical protein